MHCIGRHAVVIDTSRSGLPAARVLSDACRVISHGVELRYARCGTAASPAAPTEQVTLLADSHDTVINHPHLGELLAEAAVSSWQQHRVLNVSVRVQNEYSR
jgi:hypothetical protein